MDDLVADDWHNAICQRVCKYKPLLAMRDHAKSFLLGLVGGPPAQELLASGTPPTTHP